MNLSTLSSRIFFLYILLTLLTLNVQAMDLNVQAMDCGEDCCPANPGFTAPDTAATEDDGGQSATTDRSPGIGLEYESAYMQFESVQAKADPDPRKTTDAKRAIVNGLQGTNWKLTADLLPRKGAYDAEIVMDGKSIRPGTGDLWRAAHAAILALQNWDPSVQSPNRRVTIENSPFNDWMITDPPKRGGVNKITWEPQVTAPMPLEAIQWLIEQGNDKKIYMYKPGVNQVMVLPDFFKTHPGGVKPNDVANRPDVLGFFSIILTYAKAALIVPIGNSPKISSKIMPRTDFTTIFQTQGISQVTPRAHLYDIVKALACFKKNAAGIYVLDETFCTGSVENPTPNNQMDQQRWQATNQGQPLTIREWMQSITDGTVPDGLTTLDMQLYRSIGGFGTKLENVLDSNPPRAVPIFEFRGLPEIPTWETVSFAKAVEGNVVNIHRQSGTQPRRLKKRTSNMSSPVQRRDLAVVENACPVGCVLCDVSAMPLTMSTTSSSSSTPTTTTSSSTVASSTSTTVSITPTCTVWLSNTPISIGNANEQDNGATLRQTSFDAIKKNCPPSPANCNSNLASVDDVWTLAGGNMQELSIQYEVQISNYTDDKTFNTMLDAGLSTWQQFSTKSCKPAPKMNGRYQGCDNSDPLKRDLSNGLGIDERAIGDGEIHYPCKGGGTICNAPDHISILFEGSDGDLYNHLEIEVSIKLDGDDGIPGFECKEIIDGIGALAMAVFPELTEVDLIGETELSSLCK